METGLNTAPQRPVAVEGEVNLFAVSFDGKLASGESLTGTPTVADTGATGDLTIDNEQVSTSELEIDGVDVAAGRAVLFQVSGQQNGTEYTLKITCATDQGQTKIGFVTFTTRNQ